VRVVQEKGPGVHRHGHVRGQLGDSGDVVGAVGVGPADASPLDPAHPHLLQDARRIQAQPTLALLANVPNYLRLFPEHVSLAGRTPPPKS
jgi:hypothetical protein